MAIEVTKLNPVRSMFTLAQHYRTFQKEVEWLVTRTGDNPVVAHRYKGQLLEVLNQMVEDFNLDIVHIMERERESACLLFDMINENIGGITIFDLQHNCQVM